MKDRLKIYYIANARMPTDKAHGIQLAKMCEAFIEAGFGLELIVPRRKTDPRSIREFYGLRVEVPVAKLPVPDWYRNSRIGFGASSFVFALGYFFYLLIKRIRGERFVIYTTDIDQFSFFLIPFLGIPYFVEMHDAKPKTRPFSWLFRRVSGIVAVNGIVKSDLERTFPISPDKIIVCPNGYDPAFFASEQDKNAARAKLGLPLDKKMVMYVGRVYPWKGLEVFVNTARLMPDPLFYLVGGTADELRKIGAMEHQHPNLICAGKKNLQEIPQWLWAADVLVVLGTSRDEYSWRYTSPMKLFEYAAAERPIVASRTPAIQAAVSEREVFFCKPDSAPDLAETIQFVLTHEEDARRRLAAARSSIVSWKDRARVINDFIMQWV